MPVNLPSAIQQEKNKIDTTNAWLWLLQLDVSDSITHYYVNNIEIITVNSIEYLPLDFNISDFEKGKGNSLPTRSLTITNKDLIGKIQPLMDDYDGLVDKTVTLTPINSGFPDLDMSNKAQEFTIIASVSNDSGIGFTLGTSNPLSNQFPRNKYKGKYCNFLYLFKGVKCGYSGGETTCDGTIERCRELGNTERFGGMPGLRSKRIRFA